MVSPRLDFVVLMSKNSRCIAAELGGPLSLKFCDANTIFWKKWFVNVCIYHTLNITELNNGQRHLTATFVKFNLHK